jgi:enhancing lycopene biosynthesis protein 2
VGPKNYHTYFDVVDRLRDVTTPAYMLAQNIAEAAAGIDKLVARVLVLTE